MRRHILCGLALFAVACGDEETAATGSEGGECRVSYTPCDEGLVCRDGACREPATDSEETQLKLEVPIIETELEADGRDATPIRFRVTDADSEDPYEGEIRLWVEPPGAGYLADGLIELDGDGLGLTSFVACNKRNRDCPAFATIRFAPQEDPSEWFGARTIKLIGGNAAGRPGAPPAGPSPGQGGGEVDPPAEPDPEPDPGTPALCDGTAVKLSVLDENTNERVDHESAAPVRAQVRPHESGDFDAVSVSVAVDAYRLELVVPAQSEAGGPGLPVSAGGFLPVGRFTEADGVGAGLTAGPCAALFTGDSGTAQIEIAGGPSDYRVQVTLNGVLDCQEFSSAVTIDGCMTVTDGAP